MARWSDRKALEVAARLPRRWFWRVDTTVAVDGRVLGKLVDGAEAAAHLLPWRAAGAYRLYGCSLRAPAGWLDAGEPPLPPRALRPWRWSLSARAARWIDASQVRVRALSPDEIADYVATGEPLDKAGAYGIQGLGGSLVEAVVGSWSNVVGLPMETLCEVLSLHDWLPVDWHRCVDVFSVPG
ncbi:Maf family protein [bacterium]|nr:Maf family protein [bacterium]